MPARKPVALHNRHATKAETDARIASEEALAPERGLPMAAPARLKGHPVASEAWRRLMRLYGELEASIVSRLDQDLLIDYCIEMEHVAQMDLMRAITYQQWLELGQAQGKAKARAAEASQEMKQLAKDAAEAGADMSEQIAALASKAERAEEQAIALASKCLDAFDAVVKLDSRVEQKRQKLHVWRQSLYLTPRARAGVAPAKKDEEQLELDPMDALLGQVTNFVNGGTGDGQ